MKEELRKAFDAGVEWCNRVKPKLVSNYGVGRGQAYCTLCGCYWYH